MKYFILAFITLLFTSCLNNELEIPENQEAIDFRAQNEEEILAYIVDNDLTAIKSDSGLHYVINNQGTGAQPTTTSDVIVNYKGYFTNGIIFDENSNLSFNLQGVIPGWTEGITYFNEGGDGLLLIPSHLGYGSFDYAGIPGGSVLIFEVTLVEVE